jgi:hypothetical protein
MTRATEWLARAALYGGVMAAIGVFSTQPPYTRLAPDQAVIKLSINHPGQHKSKCRERSGEELAALAPNMRNKLSCPRERLPVRVVLDVDGRTLYDRTADPAGLFDDGWSQIYARFVVPAGAHRVEVRLADGEPRDGFGYAADWTLTLAPAQIVAIDFSEDARRLVMKEPARRTTTRPGRARRRLAGWGSGCGPVPPPAGPRPPTDRT